MKNKLNIPKEMLMNIDFINTVNGGMSASAVHLKENENDYEVHVKIPGIEVEDMQIEILKTPKGKSALKLFHLLPVFGTEKDEVHEWKSIRVINNFILPDGVAHEEISADYDRAGRELILRLPFGHDASGFRKTVDIGRI
ncbi:hypothetical protein [Dyadobacter tibetensis]|uniref:hypothetical protein n=1 Tax=Dyadobacter tibetensis TaxID=1211851 RepID=UPI00046FEF9A|nr:hypothetical protein [Dyadobacter tibetensis]